MFEVSLMDMSIILYLVNHEIIMFNKVACRIVLPIVHATCVILNTFVELLCGVCVCVCVCVCVFVCQYAAHFTDLALRTLYI
jgi:hypothetical protein